MILATSGNMHWICIEFLWEVHWQFSFKLTVLGGSISSAHKARSQTTVFQKFQVKTLTPSKKEKHLIPYKFNSKGDNLRQVEIQLSLKPFAGSFWLNNDVVLLTDIRARHLWCAECRLSYAKRVLIGTTKFKFRTITIACQTLHYSIFIIF